jgi:hypothetical protein
MQNRNNKSKRVAAGRGKTASKRKPAQNPAKKVSRKRRRAPKETAPLTVKEARFAEEYVRNEGNGTKAAIAAGYSPDSAAVIAASNLRKLKIQERIDRWVEQADVTPAEIIGAVSDIARSSLTDLLSEDGTFDLNDIRERGLGHLLKSVTIRREVGPGTGEPAEVIRFETYSRLDALQTLGKFMKLEQAPQVNINLNLQQERWVNFLVGVVTKRYPQAISEGAQVTIEDVLDRAIQYELEYQHQGLSDLKPTVLRRLSDGSFGTAEPAGDPEPPDVPPESGAIN